MKVLYEYVCMVVLVSADMPLDENSFFIYNKRYSKARLAQKVDRVITHEGLVFPDQIWMLEESDRNPGYYYINNAYYEGYRLTDLRGEIITYNGQYFEDQLWRLQKEGDYYRIYNKFYSQSRLTKIGKDDNQIAMFDGGNYEDQLWKLVPRFTATAREYVIWSIDNR